MRSGRVSAARRPARPESSTVSTAGVTTRIWNSTTGPTKEASPSTCTATGMPRLAELTYPAAIPPSVRSGSARPNSRYEANSPRPPATTVLAVNASIEGLANRSSGVRAIIRNSAAGMAAWKTNRFSTCSAWSPSSLLRPRT